MLQACVKKRNRKGCSARFQFVQRIFAAFAGRRLNAWTLARCKVNEMTRGRPKPNPRARLSFCDVHIGFFAECSPDPKWKQITFQDSFFGLCRALFAVVVDVIVCQADDSGTKSPRECKHIRGGREGVAKSELGPRFTCFSSEAAFQIQYGSVNIGEI